MAPRDLTAAERARLAAEDAREAKQAFASLQDERTRRRPAANATPAPATLPTPQIDAAAPSESPPVKAEPQEADATQARNQQGLIDASALMSAPDYTPESILYQHSVLCQTSLPYRNPGDDVRRWERINGDVSILLTAGEAFHSDASGARRFVEVGLPFGRNPRLVLYHLNTEARRTQSPVIELEDSLTAFVKRTLGLDPKGRNIRTVKDQLARISASDFRLGTYRDGHDITIKGTIVKGFELWTPRDPHQRVLWPTTVRFSQEYFESLMVYSVPLDELAITKLAHSAMALDIYTWLAQRLHRVPAKRGAFLVWPILQGQFGLGYGRLRNFRRDFKVALKQVHAVYPKARVELDGRGMTLRHSPPPVPYRFERHSARIPSELEGRGDKPILPDLI